MVHPSLYIWNTVPETLEREIPPLGAQEVLGVLVAQPGTTEAPTREAALGLLRALLTQKGALIKTNVVRPAL